MAAPLQGVSPSDMSRSWGGALSTDLGRSSLLRAQDRPLAFLGRLLGRSRLGLGYLALLMGALSALMGER